MNKSKELPGEYKYSVVTFYCFSNLSKQKLSFLSEKLPLIALENDILGTVIIASEGINGSICALSSNVDKLIYLIQSQFEKTIDTKISTPGILKGK